MSDLRLDFERELKFKISQKGKASQTDETTLIRAFRYFDLDNSGTVSQDEFLKAVQKIGVTSFENEEIRKLFNIYDLNKDGQLDYKEFAAILFGGGSFTVSKQDTPEKAPSRQSYTSEYQSSQSNYNEYKPWTYKSVPKGSEEKKKPERIAPSFEDMRQTLPLIFQRFRQRLAMKGVRGFIGLYKLFINADIHDDGVISQKDFLKILRDFKMEMIEQDWVYIFAHFDRQGSGNISFLDFMTSVLGFFSKDKKDVVDSVWKKLDPHRAGKVPIGDIKGLFKDLRNHPDVKSGRKAEDQVYSEYLDLLEFHHGVIERSKSQYITQRELEAFLLYISAVIEDENYFEMVVRTTFKLTAETSYDDVSAGGAGGRRDYNPKLGYLNDFHRSKYQGGSVSANAPFGTSTQQQNVSQAYEGSRPKTSQYGGGYSQPEPSGYQDVSQKGSYSYQSEGPSGQEVLKEVKQKILGRGVRGLLGLVKFLRGQDEDRLKSLPVNNLIRALRDFRVDISEDKFREVFNYLGLIKNGRVDYEAFLNLVKGELDQQRRRLIVGIYERISRDKKGYVTIEDIKEQFNAKQHPEVRNGKRDEDDVFMEFVDTFDLYHDIFTVSSKGRDNRVSMEEFVGYYENISCLIPDDRQFEQIINNCWRKSYKNTWEDDTSDTYQQPYDYKKSYSRNY